MRYKRFTSASQTRQPPFARRYAISRLNPACILTAALYWIADQLAVPEQYLQPLRFQHVQSLSCTTVPLSRDIMQISLISKYDCTCIKKKIPRVVLYYVQMNGLSLHGLRRCGQTAHLVFHFSQLASCSSTSVGVRRTGNHFFDD